MSKRMAVELDLSAIWEQMARNGLLRNRFAGSGGEQIEAGIRMSDEMPQHYAIDVETGQDIRSGVIEREIGPSGFTLQWNPYRLMKPEARMFDSRQQWSESADATPCLFGCQDPSNALSLLRRHAPVKTTLANFQWAALANALPVEKGGHFLWVPILTSGAITSYPHWLQVLTLPLLEDFLILAASSNNLMTYFNSMHAGASVNHIHFQSVYCEVPPAIEKASMRLKGERYVLDDYPASGLVYPQNTPVQTIWKDIAELQHQAIPVNLIHVSSRTYVIARNSDHERVDEFPGASLAGMELSGRAITTERTYFQQADWATLKLALQKSTLKTEDLLQMIKS